MPRGPLGVRRLTSLGPLVEDEDLLYHFTYKETTDSVLENGLELGTERAEAELLYSSQLRMYTSISVDRTIDALKPARRAFIPNRAGSNFFFPSLERARQRADNDTISLSNNLIVVDRSKIPARGAIGPFDKLGRIIRSFVHVVKQTIDNAQPPVLDKRSGFVDMGRVDEDFKRNIVSYWLNDTSLYYGKGGEEMEVWFHSDVPPSAIVDVVEL